MDNPYQAPSEAETPNPPTTGLRSHHVPFVIAAVCGLALAVTSNISFVNQRAYAVCFVAATVILIYDVPVCLWVLWFYLNTGEPPKLNFEPLYPTAERRALLRDCERRQQELLRAWKERPQLDDEAFYRAFYADSGIARWIAVRVRREMQKMLGRSLAGVHPGDDLELAEPEIDFADVFDRLARLFRIVIPWRTGAVSYKANSEIPFDGTFDSLVRVVAACQARKDGMYSTIEQA
jgi:hypothetical protein